MTRTQNRTGICPQLRRVKERARAHPEEQFTSLAHYLSESALLEAYNGLKANAGAGMDGQTKADYGRNLAANLSDLHQRLKQGRYRALARYRWRLWRLWFQSARRRSQKSNGQRLTHLLTVAFPLPKARITHSEGWMKVNPGDLLGRAGCGNAARPVL